MAGDAPVDLLLVAYAPPHGAIAEIFSSLVSETSKLARVAVLAPADLELDVTDAVADIRFPYASSRPDRAVVGDGWRAHRRAARLRPRAVLLFTQHPLNAAAVLHFRSSRLLFWWHEPVSRGQVSWARGAIYRVNDLVVAPRADAILVAAPSVASTVPDRHRSRTTVVPFPVLSEFTTPSSRFAASPTDLVFFGKIESYKGLDVLAGALRALAARGRSLSLRIIGLGSLERAAPAMAAYLASDPTHVEHVAEYASAEDVASAVTVSRVVVFPYLSAAASSTLAVAGALGATVVASRTGLFADFVVDGESGALFEPGDENGLADVLDRLLDDPEMCDRLGAGARRLVSERFDPGSVAAAVLDVARGPG